MAVTIDEAATRDQFVEGDSDARTRIQNAIPAGRYKTTQIVLGALRHLSDIAYLPDFLL